MPTILDSIVLSKQSILTDRKARVPECEIERLAWASAPARDFGAAIVREGGISLIAEIKRASPSRGEIRPDLMPGEIARTYENSGASAISVLTEETYFHGSDEDLQDARSQVRLPVLRKDFTIDRYQIFEARSIGADAILLIAAILRGAEIREFARLARELGMASLVEVHSAEELGTVLDLGSEIIGINNRNLHTFETSIANTLDLLRQVPADRVVVSESGIRSRDDVRLLEDAGVNAILVGESLMRERDIGGKVRELLGHREGAGRPESVPGHTFADEGEQ